MSLACPRGPTATRNGFGAYDGTCVTNRRYSIAYSWGVISPPQPQDSLPTPHHFTPNGAESPFAALSSASETVPVGALQYDTQSWNSWGEPEPMFAARYGSAPLRRHSCM